MRAGALIPARFVLLSGATGLAFFTGGYFPEAQAWAGLVTWALVAIALLLEPAGVAGSRATWLAIGGLVLFAIWSLLSITWAPIAGDAYHAGQLAMLYAGALIAATLLLREPAARRFAEPALAAGAVIVIGYGLAGRFLPGILHYSRSITAQGRLEQPLTYWNAMGELAALGLVLCVALAGDPSRSRWLRAAAAAVAAPLGMGLYVSFSRGALFACIAGLVALIVLEPGREQAWAAARGVCFGALAAVAAAPFHGVTGLAGGLSTRERQGAIVLALLIVIMVTAAAVQLRVELRERTGALRLPRRAHLLATVVICAGLAVAIVVGAHETSGTSASLSGGAARLTSLQSNRYDYWSVALRAFASNPLRGVGAGGWSVWWLRYRTIGEFAQDAHSLELQTLAELGLVGLGLLATFVAGVALAARRVLRAPPAPVAAIAALVTYLAHSPLDWDWQMPAVTLVAIALAGEVLAAASQIRGARRSTAPNVGVTAPFAAGTEAPRSSS